MYSLITLIIALYNYYATYSTLSQLADHVLDNEDSEFANNIPFTLLGYRFYLLFFINVKLNTDMQYGTFSWEFYFDIIQKSLRFNNFEFYNIHFSE